MADDDDDAQKTEEPTQKKLDDARKKGDLPLSREVNHWFMLLAGTLLITVMGGPILKDLAEILRVFIAQSHSFIGLEGLGLALMNALLGSLKVLFLPLLGLVFIAFFGPFSQVGPLFSTETIQPKLSKISPIQGAKRLFSVKALVEFAKGIFKLAAVAVVGTVIIMPYFGQLEQFITMTVPVMMSELNTLVLKMMIGVLIVVFIIAMIDLIFQRQQHHKKMRMTRQEIKDEYKQTEGDPHVRARLRQLRSEKARQRMMQAVPEADVVITNPTHFAIALKYNPDDMAAPQCVAKGIDETALRIREVAKEHDIEIVENKPLARALYDVVEIEEMIPNEYFKAVAEIISFVFKRQGRLPQG